MADEVFQGLPVWTCFPGSASDRAGVRKGDVLLFANGMRIDSLDSYVEARALKKDSVEMTLLRGNRLIDVTLDLREPNLGEADGTAEDEGLAEAG